MNHALDLTAFRNLSYGLYILTSHDGERMNGQIINTAIQVTSAPPQVAVIVIGAFGFRSGRDIDKMSGVAFRKGITGCPLITDHALSVLEAEVTDRVDLGTHSVFIGNTVGAETLKQGRPLTYLYYHEIMKGKEPPKAPTYIPAV